MLLLLICCVSVEGVSDDGESIALPVRLDSSAAPAKDPSGGELLMPAEGDMKPNALRAEKRPLLVKPAPKLVRRGGCDKRTFVTGCAVLSDEVLLFEEEDQKNCGSRNELLRCGCDVGCCDDWSGDERPDDEDIEEEDGEVEYMASDSCCVDMVVQHAARDDV